ncbi:acyl-CoA dehydrogenase N-terminal domain-containing protein [Corallococcus sp. 4LFB]|uniref:acyl-CoA dehydrogenase N-terminal domain-containing protein n=1 Tax=Corallococcus sp. 4LFB TaxID=3383249 RepID=UPI003976379F
MSAGINTYKTDLREIFFTLFEQFGFGQVAGQAPYDAWGPDEAKAVLTETYRFAREVLGPSTRWVTARAAGWRTAPSSRPRASRTRGTSSTSRASRRWR